MDKLDIKNLLFEELQEQLIELGQPAFRAQQIFQWLHQKKITNFHEMSNISLQLREMLLLKFYLKSLKIRKKLVSTIDNTVKYLYECSDGELIETVLMRYHHGNSLCISTQVGCKMGCTFCASTKAGFVRNLSPSEMLEQIYETERDAAEKISSIVLMGIGEPLDNYENVLRFFRLLNDAHGRNISLRHVTVSTCGVVDKIYDLAGLDLGITLSVSLHAPNDALRRQTMPIANRWGVADIIRACKVYSDKTGRRVTYEYALIKGLNDHLRYADELADLLKNSLCHVNLIPVNEIKEENYSASHKLTIYQFQDRLQKQGINATVRRTLGTDIQAACGQLRREDTGKKGT